MAELTIFSIAGSGGAGGFQGYTGGRLWAHVGGMHNVLELARPEECTSRFLYIDSGSLRGPKVDGKMDENYMGPVANLSSRACYPEAKRIAETMLVCYKAEYGISFCGCRMSHTSAQEYR